MSVPPEALAPEERERRRTDLVEVLGSIGYSLTVIAVVVVVAVLGAQGFLGGDAVAAILVAVVGRRDTREVVPRLVNRIRNGNGGERRRG